MFHVPVEVVPVENLIQAVVKGMRWGVHDLAADDPKIFLPLTLLPGSHGHAV
jgi:hypothetical protein